MVRRVFRWFIRIAVGFLLLSVVSVVVFRFIPIPITPLMVQRMMQQLIAGRPIAMHHHWMPLDKINPSLPLAVVASEDQNFLSHHGFDIDAIQQAMEYNKHHQRQRGASTISQQTAKNVFLLPTRSFLRKGLEVYFTFLIETVWSKRRIMEVYLNVIEMGDGIYGAEAAAQTYYHQPASSLTTYQAAAIASILPNPLHWQISHPPAWVVARQRWIVQQMNNLGGVLNYEEK